MASPLVLAMVLVGMAPVQARATESRAFRLPAEPLDSALLRFAVQADASVGGLPAPGCGGTSRPVFGTMSPERALAAMLPRGCGFERPDAHSFRIVARPQASPAPAAPQVREAASPPPPPPARLDELVITAEKRTERLTRSASAVSVLTAADIQALGGKTFETVASQMVSVAVTNLGPGRNKIFVRGLSDGSFTGKTQSTVGLYLDDVPITYNAPDPDLRLVDVDRVEVLRGPQGTLYGSGSIGGIVRIVTAKPDLTQALGEISAEAMVTQHGDPSAYFDAMGNLPLAGGRGAVRAVAYSDQSGGYIDNPVLGLRDANVSRRWGGRVAGLAELPGDWTLEGGFARQTIHTADSQYTQGPDGPLTRDSAVREPHRNDFTELGGEATHDGEGVDLKVSSAFIDHELATRYDATGAFRTAGGSLTAGAFDENKRIKLWVTEGLLTSKAPGRLRWLAGAFASYTDEQDTAALSGVRPPVPPRSIYRRRDRLSEAAVYGEASYDLSARLTATVGGRFFATRVSTYAGDFALAQAPLGPMSGRLIDRGVAPKVRVSYAVTPDAVIYVQAQEGYRAGGFNIPPAAGGSLVPERAPARFRPDHLWNYEVGGGLPLFDHTLLLRGAIFYSDWRGLQTDQRLATGLPLTVNIGDGSNAGVEAEAVWRPDERLQLRANVLLENPQITRAADAFPARRDIGLPGVPYDMGGGSVRYHWPVGAQLTAEVTGQVNYVGRSYLTFDGGNGNRMGGYGSARVGAALSGYGWRATAYVDNLADARGNTFAFGNPFSRTRATQATPLRPRTVGVGLSRRF